MSLSLIFGLEPSPYLLTRPLTACDMLALYSRAMARPTIWARVRSSLATSATTTGQPFDLVMADLAEGMTIDRIIFSLQMFYDEPNSLLASWARSATFGIIAGPGGASAPPARPQTNQLADWLWLEPILWSVDTVTHNSSGVVVGHQQASISHQVQAKANRLAPAGGLRLWGVWEWDTPWPAGTATMRRKIWCSTSILTAV